MTSETQSPNPYVFVVGCPRSGTTLLQRMLNHHPALAVANDTHFVTRVLEKHAPQVIADAQAGQPIPLTPDLLAGLLQYHRFPRLGLQEEQVREAAREALTYQQLVRRLYDTFASMTGKRLAGEKTPDFVRRLELLHGLFPAARLVHIIRDGRDVTLSLLQWANESKGPGRFALWQNDPLAVCALWWRRMVVSGRKSGAGLLPAIYREVPYEQLVREPETHLRELCAFLEIPWSVQMLRYHEGRMKSNPTLSAKKAWLPPTCGLRDWRTQMKAEDVELFEALAGDVLDSLGLERAFPSIGTAARQRAEVAQTWWDQKPRRRVKKSAGPAGQRRI